MNFVCIAVQLKMYSLCFYIVEEIQKKIKSLRTQYTRERQKVKKRKSGDGADAIYTSKWIHFQQLQFLDDFVAAKKTVSNYRKVQYTFYIQHNLTHMTAWQIKIKFRILLHHIPLPRYTSMLRIEILAEHVSKLLG